MKPHRYNAMAGPVCNKMYTIPAMIGGAITNVNIVDLTISNTNVPNVVLLNPCFSSITNVEYRDQGRDMHVDINDRTSTHTILCPISPPPNPILARITPESLHMYG
jgi:hypothetical protein